MAGGSGERFWPLSRRLRPKQLLRLAHPEKSLLQQSIERVEPIVPKENIFIATARHLKDAILAAHTGLPEKNILCEPCKRNTAGCLVYAAASLITRYPDPSQVTIAVLTADHLIRDAARFRESVETAWAVAEEHHSLVVMGIKPTRPETGYGYIETKEQVSPVMVTSSGIAVLPAAGFREKPDRATAETFVKSGRFFWNSGMFFWRLQTFLDELRDASPTHAEATWQLAEALRAGDTTRVETLFESLPDISIDYALMEKARRVHVVRADFDWDDIGAWDALERTYPTDAEGNVCIGDPIVIDSKSCIVYNELGDKDMAVGVVGVDNLAVIVSRDGILVIPKDRAQDVRKVVAELKNKGYRQL